MGGNGEYIPHNGTIIIPPPGVIGTPIQLPAGLGGGCVTEGPFTTISLGPMSVDGAPVGPQGGFGANPRCLKRDVGPAITQRYSNYSSVLRKLIAHL